MNVLFLVPRFLPDIGGVETHAYRVAKGLIEQGYRIQIVTGTHRKDLCPEEREGGITIYRCRLSKSRTNKSSAFLDLAVIWLYLLRHNRLFTESNYIHLHDFQTFLWFFPFLVLYRKPVFITFHGFEKYPVPVFAKIARKTAEKMVDGNICVGSFISNWYGTNPQAETIGGVDTQSESQNCCVQEAAIYIGRLETDTNILGLVNALAILRKSRGVSIPLHIFGDGSLRSKIETCAQENNLEIHTYGFQASASLQLPKYRYVFASGFLSILDAMSYGKVVFTLYDNPLKRDYFYSIPNAESLMHICSSPVQLSDELFTVINSPKQAAFMSQKAFDFAKQQSWAKVTKLYLALYEKRGS
jgi:glycosyltransferase involved in cell wall biosynthesis